MKKIGLTGSIGSGKSSVSNIFMKNNIKIIDADKIAREILDKGNTLKEIVDYFGIEVLDSNNNLDRKKLGNLVFSDANKLDKLNDITHPKIKEEIQKKIDDYESIDEKIVILDIPLLIESHMTNMADLVLLITCNEDIQINRIMNRDNISKSEAIRRIKSQMNVEEKKKYADYIIDNSSTIEELEYSVKKFLNYLEGNSFE